jgi:CheY-like chemotaxis protein
VGKGTTFEVYLPLAREQSTLTRSPDPNSDRLDGKETLLFVEDEQIVRGVGTRILRTRGYRVIEATGGDEALEIAAAGTPIDLVVTDMVMPGMTGRQLAERLLEFYPGIRVLFVSGYAERSLGEKTPDCGNLPFLQKPYDPHTLAAKVREVLDGEPAVKRLQ